MSNAVACLACPCIGTCSIANHFVHAHTYTYTQHLHSHMHILIYTYKTVQSDACMDTFVLAMFREPMQAGPMEDNFKAQFIQAVALCMHIHAYFHSL